MANRNGIKPRRRKKKKVYGTTPMCMQTEKGHGDVCGARILDKGEIKCFIHRGGDKE